MLDQSAVLVAVVYFSYSQFCVFDRSVTLPGCAWTDAHFRQGFARREENVCFGTLLEFGHAELAVHLGPYEAMGHHERVVEVPLSVSSGEIVIAGPEDTQNEHLVQLAPGHYRLVVAQTVTAEDREAIALHFERLAEPLLHSRIVVCDDALAPPDPLVETVDVA
jgi:hypothetical protein